MSNPFKGMKQQSQSNFNYTPGATGNAPFDAKIPPFDEKGIYPNLLGARGLHPGPEGNKTPTMDLLNKGK